MTNEEAFEKLFGISIRQFMEMPQEDITHWAKETNQILWGGFNGPKHNLDLNYQMQSSRSCTVTADPEAIKNITSWN